MFKLTRNISQPLVFLEKAYEFVLLRWEDQLASAAGSTGVSARLIRQKNKIPNKKKTRKPTICSFIRKEIIGKENHNINTFFKTLSILAESVVASQTGHNKTRVPQSVKQVIKRRSHSYLRKKYIHGLTLIKSISMRGGGSPTGKPFQEPETRRMSPAAR